MENAQRASADQARRALSKGRVTPAEFRAALMSVPPTERDAWLDLVLELDGLPDDDPGLPRGCVPYLPCSVDALVRMVDAAGVQASDVFVDVGSGVGRAAAAVHLLSGAVAMGLEVQPGLVLAARELAARFPGLGLSFVEGEAAQLAGDINVGSVFFLYCPFSGERLMRVLDGLERIATAREIRICCVDLPLPARSWLTLVASSGNLEVYRSVLCDEALAMSARSETDLPNSRG